MTNFRFASFAAAVTLTAGSAIAQDAPIRFEHDGQTYLYTIATEGSRTIIDGKSLSTGARYHLIVRDGRVTGSVDDRAVDFPTPKTRSGAAVIASTN